MEVFESCGKISELLNAGQEAEARNELIKLLDRQTREGFSYSPLINHLIRETGLYPYLDIATASWVDRFIYEAFKVDIGQNEPVTLHREQSAVLRKLLEGTNLAVSAPTSFGKSFVIDAYISIKKPKNVLIIVPTVALTDETRRRLQKKFSTTYKIITTSDALLSERNLFVFPQERAIHYCNIIKELDLLVIDEFYKASQSFDKERAPALVRAMLKLGEIAKQRYYLAPNITSINENPFTTDMVFLKLDFNTVFLQKYDLYKEILKDEDKKSEYLLDILRSKKTRSLIYAGSYSNVERVANLLNASTPEIGSELLNSFAGWLSINYDRNWKLTSLIKRGTGIHTGQLHRSLSQIQVHLFEVENGLHNIISTSSIIEGVNTSAENVIIWSNKNGRPLLNDFTYRNIIGRSGRMFKHFVGNVYILESPPPPKDTQLELGFPDEVLGDIDEQLYKKDLTTEQVAKIVSYKTEMTKLLGSEAFARIQAENSFMTSDISLLRDIAMDMFENKQVWRGLAYLNSPDVEAWDRMLYKIIRLWPGVWESTYTSFVGFIKALSRNWESSIPDILDELDSLSIGVDQFFKLERLVTYKLAALLNDVNILQKEIIRDGVDISPYIARVSRGFLPSCVYQLEEYGLPRMISKKLHVSKLINFNDHELTLHVAVEQLLKLQDRALNQTEGFDRFILEYFFDGLTSQDQAKDKEG